MTLAIQLLGPAEIRRGEQPLVLPGYRPLALLAYLLLTGKPQSREHLIELLFERPGDPRAALRSTLYQLRQALGVEYLRADRQEVAFNFASDYWLDVDAFTAGELEHYRGELLESFYLRDARRFEEWLAVERQNLQDQYKVALERRLEEERLQGKVEATEQTARQLLLLDNLREDWHRALMTTLAQQGRYEAALAQYEQCRQVAKAEFEAEPAPETTLLAEAIREEQASRYRELAIGSPLAVGLAPAEGPPEPKRAPARQEAGAPGQSSPGPADRGRWWRTGAILVAVILLVLAVVAISRVAGIGQSPGADAAGDASAERTPVQALAGTTVTIVGPFGRESEVELAELSMRPFEERTGIDIVLVPIDDVATYVANARAASALPDIILFPQLGFLADFAREGKTIDLRRFLDDEYLRQQYPEDLLGLVEIEGQMAGAWYAVNVKSLVWYPRRAFAEMGYAVPQTWADLMALSDQIVADGGTPWCIGIASGDSTGWVGTDWVEDILLRTAPPEAYDAWVKGELPFDSLELRRVFAIMESIWLNDDYVYGGTANIVEESAVLGPNELLADPPECYLLRQASFVQAFFREDAVLGQDYDFFELPPIDPAYGRAVVGGGDIHAMFNDRPEVRAVMEYLTTAESIQAQVQAGGKISPHRDTPFEWYDSPADLRLAQIVLAADTFRFDGSDLMPPEVGVDSFWKGIVAWVEGEELGTVLATIDASWPDGE